MKLSFQGDLAPLQTGLSYLAPVLDVQQDPTGTVICVQQGGNGLSISASNGGYTITYAIPSDFFRALALLCGMLREGKTVTSLSEERKFDSCGVMIDCSRNAVLRVETAKDLLRKMACMGLNTAMLYTEDTYEIEEYPYFGYLRGAYTKEELRELDRYALALGIELIPCIQTLGHLKMALHWHAMAEVRDTDRTLLADEEKTYQLIEAMFRTLRECFTTKKLHIGMDEAPDIGTGEHLRRFGYEDQYTILTRHLERVVSIAKTYGFEPMMWSDLFFRLGSKTHAYYDVDADIPADLSKKIPQNLSMVYWDYYHKDDTMYRTMIREHQKLGRNIIFAGGIWKWSGMGVRYDQTFHTTIPALQVCQEMGVRDVFATMWGDDGAEVDIYTTLLGLQLYAEYNYHGDVTMEHLKEYFRLCLGLDMDAFLALQLDDFPPEFSSGETAKNVLSVVSKAVLYQDPLCGLFDKDLEGINLKGFYQSKLDTLSAIEAPEQFAALFAYQRQLLRVLLLKCDIGIKIRSAYQAKDMPRLQQCCTELDTLVQAVTELEERFTTVWESSNKIFGLDRVQLRFGGLIMRLQAAKRRLQLLTSGKTDSLEELETQLLSYANGGVIGEQIYHNIASASSSGV